MTKDNTDKSNQSTSKKGPTKQGPSNLVVRIAAAAVLVPVALFVAWYGGILFTMFIATLGVLMALEWVKMAHKGNFNQLLVHIGAVLIAAFSTFYQPLLLSFGLVGLLWLASMIMLKGPSDRLWKVLGIPYITLPIFALVWLRADPQFGVFTVFTVFASVWSADSLAYFAGRGFGGPKLWPSVSPNKTWSGFFGAVVGGMLGASLVFWIAGLDGIAMAAVLGAAIGGLEQGGDLFESAAKRTFGIKDSGNIIPGHGGVLDRVDGLMVAVVFALAVGAWRSGLGQAAQGFVSW